MRRYELTERGKIVIAALIVVILLALSALLIVMALANQSSAPQTSGKDLETTTTSVPSAPAETPPIPTNSPPPNGGGFTPPDVTATTDGNGLSGGSGGSGDNGGSGDSGGSGGSGDNGDEEPAQSSTPPPGTGPTGGNPSEGTLSFIFSPVYQTELDEETAALLDELLGSPGNTLNSTIAVETPALQSGYAETLMAAVVSAFAARGVAEHRIAQAIDPSATAGEFFEIKLYFIPASGK